MIDPVYAFARPPEAAAAAAPEARALRLPPYGDSTDALRHALGLSLPASPRPAPSIGCRQATSAEVTSSDGVFQADVVEIAGREMFRPEQHVSAGALGPGDSWRREVDLSLSPPGFNSIGLAVTVGAFDLRQPLVFGAGVPHGVGSLTRSVADSAFELGASFTVPDTGIRYSGAMSWSSFGVVAAPESALSAPLVRTDPAMARGASYWQKLDLDLWRSPIGEASAYLVMGAMDASYRSLESRSAMPLFLDGRTLEYGASLRRRSDALSFMHQTVASAAMTSSMTTGRLRWGRIDLALDSGAWDYRDRNQATPWGIGQRHLKVSARFSLANPRRADTPRLKPSFLKLKARRSRGSFDSAGSVALTEYDTIGMDFGWSGAGRNTEFGVSVATRRIGLTTPRPSRSEEVSLDFTQVVFGEGWDVSAYGSLSVERSIGRSEHILRGGAQVSIEAKRAKLSLALDVNRLDSRFEPLSDAPLRADMTQDISISASADLSGYLRGRSLEPKPYLRIKAYADLSRHEGGDARTSSTAAPTVLLVWGTSF